ncbi:MAG: molybdate ABC transporter substrate-binding protein [Candidatus Hydrogenedentes bacterium]|nr:molybdate ABC transporter substrate-binding protein [Candidatus Hydrogenedentota bacterium]
MNAARWFAIPGVVVILAGCGPMGAPSGELTLFAAASTTDAVTEVAAAYRASTGTSVRINLAASSTLARQIEQGARADVFLSANEDWMDYLETRNNLESASRLDLLGNDLVLIAPSDAPFEFDFETDGVLPEAFEGRLALGDPAHVPGGLYARQALEHYGWWDALQDRLIPAMDVRAALYIVERGEAAAGVVYASDAVAADDSVVVAARFPEASYTPIRYPAALCMGAGEEAQDFLAFLQSEEAGAVFARHGFVHLPTHHAGTRQ